MYKVGIIGLGYVGLPLAKRIAIQHQTIGFDINVDLVNEINKSYRKKKLTVTNDREKLYKSDIFIITVPTPVNKQRKPDLIHIEEATKTVAKYLRSGNIVIYESTVYPGCTEDFCIPILEKESGFKVNQDFYVGYSPERINPGNSTLSLERIVKVTSGSNQYAACIIDDFYRSIIPAGTHLAKSIKVAEASKLMENIQRDVNIGLVNEMAMIFYDLKIDTNEILEAASTKWNFHNYTPGLVGGHCISVDPYYMISQVTAGNDIMKSARKVNENVPFFISNIIFKNVPISSRILILGFTFKENVPDIRNTKVFDLINYLIGDYKIDIYDPLVNTFEVFEKYKISILEKRPKFDEYQAIILAVPHEEFMLYDWKNIRKEVPYIFDVKGTLPKKFINDRL